jgi:hypothetical protein
MTDLLVRSPITKPMLNENTRNQPITVSQKNSKANLFKSSFDEGNQYTVSALDHHHFKDKSPLLSPSARNPKFTSTDAKTSPLKIASPRYNNSKAQQASQKNLVLPQYHLPSADLSFKTSV